MNNIIGISGVAGSGKDTFFDFLSERIPCEKYSLADELKREVRQWCRMHYQVDSVDCSRDQKETIRPFLVAHGSAKRKLSEGRHWIEKLNDKIINGSNAEFKVVTDIRYDDYDNDEVSWLRDELGGILVHVSQYKLTCGEVDCHEPDSSRVLIKKFKAPANAEEARNDPKIKEKSDYLIEWEFINNGRIEELTPYVDNFVSWLSSYDYEKRTNGPDLGEKN